ncbi:hypothetical protein [Nocardia terpenica]|uniref:hypothetical protein n=1 Tax=Nocardia terpenica TaxID=455432 RepID=UPI0012FE3F3A|nr:hypothetical protein [Nocardia terpenica]
MIDWIRYCRNGPPRALLMTGRTERTVINNLVLPILDMLGPHRVKINLGNGTVNICGRNVILIGANNESARTKIQVPRPDFAGSPHHIRTATEAVDQHPHIGNTGCSAARWIPPGRKSDQRQKGTFT